MTQAAVASNAAAAKRDFTEVELLEMMARYAEMRDQANWCGSFQKSIGTTIKEWLAKHGGLLTDHERGTIARLQLRGGGPELDVTALAARDPGLLANLARHGCLKLNFQAFKEQAALHASTKRYLYPGKDTIALVVETKADRERQAEALQRG